MRVARWVVIFTEAPRAESEQSDGDTIFGFHFFFLAHQACGLAEASNLNLLYYFRLLYHRQHYYRYTTILTTNTAFIMVVMMTVIAAAMEHHHNHHHATTTSTSTSSTAASNVCYTAVDAARLVGVAGLTLWVVTLVEAALAQGYPLWQLGELWWIHFVFVCVCVS